LNTHEERAPDYVEHIVGAIDRIKTYVSGFDEQQFLSNTLVQDGVLRQLMVVGEASNRLMRQCPAFAKANIARGYTDIDLEVVWSIVVDELPGFRNRMQTLLDSLRK
jgi:uncharacterized protein with HEPN domain